VLTAVAIIPSPPLLVPELAGAAAAEVADLRAAVLRAAAVLPDRWIAVGAGTADVRVGPAATGTFAGFGVDVPVALAPGAHAAEQLPLCALITGWIREQVAPHAVAEVCCFTDRQDAVNIGRALRAEIDAHADPVGVLIVADGCRTLTPSAPGGYEPADVAIQQDLDEALGRGDSSALTGLATSVVGRVAFGVLAGLIEPAPTSAQEFYRGAPFGVGYFAGVWQP
jgi:hypothetical protein